MVGLGIRSNVVYNLRAVTFVAAKSIRRAFWRSKMPLMRRLLQLVMLLELRSGGLGGRKPARESLVVGSTLGYFFWLIQNQNTHTSVACCAVNHSIEKSFNLQERTTGNRRAEVANAFARLTDEGERAFGPSSFD